MAGREDCLAQILSAAGGRKTRADVEAELDSLDAAAQEYASRGYDQARAYQRAAEDKLRQEATRRALMRKQERENAFKLITEQNRIAGEHRRGNGPRLSIQAMTSGVNVPGYKSQNSMAAMWNAYRDKWTGNWGVVGTLEREGLFKPYMAGGAQMDRNVARELGQLEMGANGNPGYTKDALALKVAKIFHAFDKLAVDEHNTVGGWIQNLQSHVIKQTHGPDAIRHAAAGGNQRPVLRYDFNPMAPKGGLEADRSAWIADVKKWFDMKKSFGPLDPNDILPQMWASFSDGDHFDYAAPTEGGEFFANVAQKAAAHRELVPNDVDSMLAYNQKYGLHKTFRDAKFAAYDSLARQTALVGRLGTKPAETFDALVNYGKMLTKGTPEFKKLADFEHRLRAEMAQLDGSSNRPIYNLAHRIIGNVMDWERMSMLGRVAITHIEGLASKADVLRYAGVGFTDRYAALARGFTKDRALNEALWTNANAALSNLKVGGLEAVDGAPGALAWAQNWFFKLTGVVQLLERQQNETTQTVSRQIGLMRGRKWADVEAKEQRWLRAFGIEEPEWKALNKVEWTKGRAIDGNGDYLTPDVAMKLSDDDMHAYLAERPTYGQYAYGAPVEGKPAARYIPDSVIAKARHDLAMTIASSFNEAGRASVFAPSIKTKAFIFGNNKPGSFPYEALRLLMQFKMWPLEMYFRQWNRMIYGGDRGMDRISGIVQFATASLILGSLGEMIRDTAKGQNPLAEMQANPFAYMARGFLRSGAGTIMGDYLIGEYNTHGNSVLASLAGPIVGQLPNLIDLWHGGGPRELHPWKHRANDALQLLKSNTPFVNLWFTDWAFQYLLLHNLQESINPGYIERAEKRAQDQRGTQFMVRPSAMLWH